MSSEGFGVVTPRHGLSAVKDGVMSEKARLLVLLVGLLEIINNEGT